MTQDMAEAMWLKHPKTGVVWLVAHADTQQRCLADGYTLVPDPRLPEPEPTPAEVQPSPDELAAVVEAQAAQVQQRNDAARKAFGLEPAKRPQPGVRKGVKRATI